MGASRLPDLVGFVSDLPLVVVELNNPGVPARDVRREPDGLQTANPGLFGFNALLIASDGTVTLVGSRWMTSGS